MFRIASNTLYEGLVTLERDLSKAENPDDPVRFSEISLNYRYEAMEDDQYYDEPEFNAILTHYRQTIRNGTILMPIGGLRVIQNLQALSGNDLMLLSADKAYAEVAPMTAHNFHDFAAHGSFSFMVNYDAIGTYFRHGGGVYFHEKNRTDTLKVVCGVQTPQAGQRMERLSHFFRSRMRIASPAASITEIVLDDGKEDSDESVERLLSHIRLSLADPRILCMRAKRLIDRLPNMDADQKHDLLSLMHIAGEKFYFYRGEMNLPFWLADLYYQLDRQEESLAWLEKAMHCYDEFSSEYLVMMGRSHERLNQWRQAKAVYEKSLDLQPDFVPAIDGLNRIQPMLPN